MSKLVTIDFHDDTLFATEDAGAVFVATTPICNALGISPDRQRDRIRRDTILSEGATMMGVPSTGGTQETFVLRLDLVNAWLMGIDDKRIADPEARARVLTYKRECAAVLHRHFYGRRGEGVGMTHPPLAAPAEGLSPAVAVAIVREARLNFGPRASGKLWRHLGLPLADEMGAPPAQGELALSTAPAAR